MVDKHVHSLAHFPNILWTYAQCNKSVSFFFFFDKLSIVCKVFKVFKVEIVYLMVQCYSKLYGQPFPFELYSYFIHCTMLCSKHNSILQHVFLVLHVASTSYWTTISIHSPCGIHKILIIQGWIRTRLFGQAQKKENSNCQHNNILKCLWSKRWTFY
jgi:hypothetical protein